MDILKLAWKNIIHHPLNLIMSVVLFGLGVGLISFILLFNAQLKDKFDKNLAGIDLVVGAKGSPLQLILCNMYHIDNPTGNISIQEAAPLLRDLHPLIDTAIPLSLGDNYQRYRIVGTNHDFAGLYSGVLAEGKLWEEDFEVTIGQNVSAEAGLKIGDTFSSAHGLGDDEHVHDEVLFKVVGIFEETGSVLDQLILTNTASVWLVHDHGHDEEEDHNEEASPQENDTDIVRNSNADLLRHPENDITSILIKYKSKKNFQALNFGRNINDNTEMQAASPAIEINRLYNMIGLGTDMLRYLAWLIAFVSALSIFISLLKSMRERRYELAIMRVLGASRTKVFGLIVLEGLILAFVGYIIGSILSHVGMEWASDYLKADFRYNFTGWIFLKEEWWILAMSLGLGILAALIPAAQAARTDINKTLTVK